MISVSLLNWIDLKQIELFKRFSGFEGNSLSLSSFETTEYSWKMEKSNAFSDFCSLMTKIEDLFDIKSYFLTKVLKQLKGFFLSKV